MAAVVSTVQNPVWFLQYSSELTVLGINLAGYNCILLPELL